MSGEGGELEKVSAGFELSEAERERMRAAVEAMVPVFEQVRRAMVEYARAVAPVLAQLAASMEKIGRATQSDYALAPPRPDSKGRHRGPGRTGRAAQRSPYGPQRRR